MAALEPVDELRPKPERDPDREDVDDRELGETRGHRRVDIWILVDLLHHAMNELHGRAVAEHAIVSAAAAPQRATGKKSAAKKPALRKATPKKPASKKAATKEPAAPALS